MMNSIECDNRIEKELDQYVKDNGYIFLTSDAVVNRISDNPPITKYEYSLFLCKEKNILIEEKLCYTMSHYEHIEETHLKNIIEAKRNMVKKIKYYNEKNISDISKDYFKSSNEEIKQWVKQSAKFIKLLINYSNENNDSI